jgi:Rad3-related DNA helicase
LIDVFGLLFDSDSTSNDFVICLEKSRSKRQQAELETCFRHSAGGMQAVGPKKPRLEEDERQFDYHLKIICLNPALAFEDIKKVTRTIIITSGTLSPMNTLQADLNTNFNFAHQISALHVVSRSNVWVGIVHESSSPKKPSLKIVKDTQKSVDTQDELGSIMLKICKTVPFGVLVVVPSYGFLNDLRSRWSQRLNDSDSELPVVLPVNNSQTQPHNSLEAEAI